MILKVQVITFIFSLLFGMYFSFLIDINHKIIYDSRRLYRLPTTFFLIVGNAMLYFWGLEHLNNGILHFYLLLAIIIGFIIEHYLYTRFVKKKIK